MQVPAKMFFADSLPKTATGKIQRRFMVDAFINKKAEGESRLFTCLPARPPFTPLHLNQWNLFVAHSGASSSRTNNVSLP
jgi:hypothetical protein